jgi:hypothetical protein
MVVAEGRFLNLSTLGGLMESFKPMKPKTSVRLRMVPSGKSALEIIVRVVWARKTGSAFTYGIRFLDREPSPAN